MTGHIDKVQNDSLTGEHSRQEGERGGGGGGWIEGEGRKEGRGNGVKGEEYRGELGKTEWTQEGKIGGGMNGLQGEKDGQGEYGRGQEGRERGRGGKTKLEKDKELLVKRKDVASEWGEKSSERKCRDGWVERGIDGEIQEEE